MSWDGEWGDSFSQNFSLYRSFSYVTSQASVLLNSIRTIFSKLKKFLVFLLGFGEFEQHKYQSSWFLLFRAFLFFSLLQFCLLPYQCVCA